MKKPIKTKLFIYQQFGNLFHVTCIKTGKTKTLKMSGWLEKKAIDNIKMMLRIALITSRTYVSRPFFLQFMSEEEIKSELLLIESGKQTATPTKVKATKKSTSNTHQTSLFDDPIDLLSAQGCRGG